jgi:hypothetical protein
MKVRNQKHVYVFRLKAIKEGKSVKTIVAWMDAAVEQDSGVSKF